MPKSKLRLTFNIVLAIITVGYTLLILIDHINMAGVAIYAILFFGLLIIRDKITPNKKQSGKDVND